MTAGSPPGAALRKYRYVAFAQTYEQQTDGTVLVTADDGRSGRFHVDGRYIEGDLTQANLHMLVWTGARPQHPRCRYRWGEVPVDVTRPSGWPEALEQLFADRLGPPRQ